jgi:hypothetical protein
MPTPPALALTPEGYAAPPQNELRAWLEAVWKEKFGASSTTKPSTLNGKFIDFATVLLVAFFEGGAGAANSGWFTSAPGVALEKILALFALPRIPASSSIVEAVLYGTDATNIGGGSIVSVDTTLDKFITQNAIVLGGDQGYVVRINNSSAGDDYTVEIAGQPWTYTAQGGDTVRQVAEGLRDAIIAGGQQVTAVVPPNDDQSNRWLIVIEDNGIGPFVLDVSGTGGALLDEFAAKRVPAIAQLSGPRQAAAGDLNAIETPVGGWEGVTNTADATLGANAETDAAYRDRHRGLLNKGTASEQAIKTAVALLPGVEFVAVRANDDDVVDSEGLPPHSIRVTVLGGDDVEIAETIMATKAAGIQTYGNDFELVLDGENLLKPIYFQRPTLKYLWIKLELTPGEKFQNVGDPGAAIAKALALWGDLKIGIGDDIERYAFGEPVNATVPGIKGAVITMGFTLNELDPQPPLVAADLVMSSTELGLFDSSRIIVEFV